VAGEGAAVNAVTLAELCVGDAEPSTVADRVRGWGVEALDIPSAVVEITARAFVSYRNGVSAVQAEMCRQFRCPIFSSARMLKSWLDSGDSGSRSL
jgi:hypothetical protein